MLANLSDKLCLCWKDFESNISTSFRELCDGKEMLDVSLACDDSMLFTSLIVKTLIIRRNPDFGTGAEFNINNGATSVDIFQMVQKRYMRHGFFHL